MGQYHLNDEGNPGLCKAKQGRCPFGPTQDHFDTAEQAREAYEAQQSMGDLLSNAMRANPKTRAMQERIDRNEAFRKHLHRAYVDSPEVDTDFEEVDTSHLRAYNETYFAYDETLTEEERKAMYDYAGISYDPINKYLREPDEFQARSEHNPNFDRAAWAQEQIELLDEAIAKAPPQQRQLFRRLDQSTVNDLVSSEDWAQDLGFVAGEKVKFKSYSSTTVNPGYIARTAHHDPHTSVVLVIDTDQGAPVGPTVYDRARTHTQEGEAEILLPRDSNFEVMEVKRAGYADGSYGRVEVLTVFLKQI